MLNKFNFLTFSILIQISKSVSSIYPSIHPFIYYWVPFITLALYSLYIISVSAKVQSLKPLKDITLKVCLFKNDLLQKFELCNCGSWLSSPCKAAVFRSDVEIQVHREHRGQKKIDVRWSRACTSQKAQAQPEPMIMYWNLPVAVASDHDDMGVLQKLGPVNTELNIWLGSRIWETAQGNLHIQCNSYQNYQWHFSQN